MKDIFFKICYLANFIMVGATILLPIAYMYEEGYVRELLNFDFVVIIRGISSFLALILWIYCIYIWAKADRKVYRLFLLLFLNIFYLVFYYPKTLKEGWN